ncbi:carbohydrate ABC transporter permease [Sulfobacillus thermosulfidooxidans]|uniref:Glucose/mannose transport system permease protein n=2 Tax=Sulfobacillus thermosulfidooxidans TaxID=28034 RepID=A0A1W1W7Z4_SULTA|nr:carbohydrate ABC transporter permease [Sulfobacillus thermosulfidooxidans]OLZ10510.1 ABC transporter permease [Sulfobacillus thermosulfidooxidans]OLZ14234.1 ABC transporter permease [Sulfobacillus thermosulfidooxidans]OLZ18977.1 ABC transporter permease [Sulfobacillus thermosulfidooxidans]PSR25095.1 MAG: carbohydrate ABC transporter permease [Sulfobacillus thermosulfidooxidans]SMC02421.1 glucose/mannose transport system permease protein [Sulfobacillus thermosulfidooxidans DSM 9293]
MAVRRLNRSLLYLLLTIFAVLYLMPVYVVAVTSLKSGAAINLSQMWDLPQHISFASLATAWQKLGPNFMNSVYLTIPATVISSLIGAMNGYALAKWRFKGSNTVFFIILLGMFIPYQAVLIPVLRVLDTLHLYGSIPGLILVNVVYGIPITTLIFRNFYAAIPDEMIEAGKIDGAGYWGIFRYIVLPLSASGFVVTGIWQFTQIWNNFLFAVSVTNPPHQPVTVAVVNIAGSQTIQWNVQMASALMASIPTLVVYIFLGKYFVRGLLAGSVKG